jgi:hypothetical protein
VRLPDNAQGQTTNELGDKLNTFQEITNYNNYYEFSEDKQAPAVLSKDFKPTPWSVQVGGLVQNPKTFAIDDLLKFQQKERIYRLRCVEAWSMVIPWTGFELNDLLNVYSAIACNPQKLPNAKFDAAMTFIRYMVSEAGQNLFANFGVQQYGGAVFKPCVQILKTGTSADIAQMIKNYAYLKDSTGTPTECPSQWRYNAGDLYS